MWDDHMKGRVVGVMKDFNNGSFRRELALLISSWYRGYEQASVRLATVDMGKGIQSLEKCGDRPILNLFSNMCSWMTNFKFLQTGKRIGSTL